MTAHQRSRKTPRLAWLHRLWSLSTGRFGVVVVLVIGLTALLARFWTPFDPQKVDVANRWDAPGIPHLLGTDGSGRDILSLLMAGARTTVWVALGAGLVATLLGLVLAALGALTTRWVRESVAVLVDILIAFPVLLIAMMLSSVWGGSLWVVIVSVGIGFGVNIARVTRPELRLYRGETRPWHVRSERGEVSPGGEEVELIDQVLVKHVDARERPLEITTSRMTVLPDKRYAQTRQAVRIVGANGATTATGMNAYLDEGRISLLSNVRGQHELR